MSRKSNTPILPSYGFIRMDIVFSSLQFSEGITWFQLRKKYYTYKDNRIHDFKSIILRYKKKASHEEKLRLNNYQVRVNIDLRNQTFKFIRFNLYEFVMGLSGEYIPTRRIRRENVSEIIENKVESVKNVIKSASMGIDNIEFHDGSYYVWLIIHGKRLNSIEPLKVLDSSSYSCLRFVHKYFADRFPKDVQIEYDEKRVLRITKPYTLSHYVRVLCNNMYAKGEWWEEVFNARKPSLKERRSISTVEAKKKAIKEKNDYLYNLSCLQSNEILNCVQEFYHGKEEDAFIFTIDMPNGRRAVVFENVSPQASRTTWVFITSHDNYETCINRVSDYFSNYLTSNKRFSLRDKSDKEINPPEAFLAENYHYIYHNDLGQWLKKMDKVLERESHQDNIEFTPGLHIPQSQNERTGHKEIIATKNIHNELMQQLYDKLCKKHGEENVGSEVRVGARRIDIVVKCKECFDIYEIKSAQNPFDCVTEALGQICQYAYLYCRDKIGKMVIVGSSTTTSEVENYLSWFRNKHSLEVYYLKV